MPTEPICNDCEQDPCDCKECSRCGNKDAPFNICNDCGGCASNACCTCWYCMGCEEKHTANDYSCCENCNRCEAQCECSHCENCGETRRSDSMCSRCDYCTGCCECGTAGEYGVEFWRANTPVFHDSNKNQFKRNGSRRYVSVEIEVAGLGEGDGEVTEAVRNWEGCIVEDGSLPSAGFEINTAPANGDKFIQQISEICGALKDQDAEVDKSCGLHVHVDARDHNFYDIRKLAFLYQKIESGLYSVVPPSRRNSHYCMPCGDKYVKDLEHNRVPKDNENKVLENIYGYKSVNKIEVKGNKYHEARYGALNIHSWMYRGTIECRMHSGTVSFDKITNWGVLWASIIDYAFNHNEKFIRSITGDSFSILLTIAPNDEIKKWLVERRNKFSNSNYHEANVEQ